MSQGVDYESLTQPLGQSMNMVADHLARAPALRYRTQLERERLRAENEVRASQVGNYNAQTKSHEASARKATLEGDAQETKNISQKWLQENDQTFSGLVDSGTVTPEQMNVYARHYATATGSNMKDVVSGLTALAQAKRAARGDNIRDVATMTGSGAASVVNQDSRNATSVANQTARLDAAGNRPLVVPERASVLPAGYMDDQTTPYTQPSRSRPGSENNLYDPATRRALEKLGEQLAEAEKDGVRETSTRIMSAITRLKGKRVSPEAATFNKITAPQANQSQDPDDHSEPVEEPAGKEDDTRAGGLPLPKPATFGVKKLDGETAKAILQEVGGDKQKARELARQRGYSF